MLNVVNLAAVTVFARVISRVFFLRCRCGKVAGMVQLVLFDDMSGLQTVLYSDKTSIRFCLQRVVF